MTRIEIKSRVGPDGVLNVNVPSGLANKDVLVTVQSVDRLGEESRRDDWKTFIDQTAGRWAGEPLVRPEQGDFENRRSWE